MLGLFTRWLLGRSSAAALPASDQVTRELGAGESRREAGRELSGPQQALERIALYGRRYRATELRIEHLSDRWGPILKEIRVALEAKLAFVQDYGLRFHDVSSMRAKILLLELRPMLDALEQGLEDLERLLSTLARTPVRSDQESDGVYDVLAQREGWLLSRLVYTTGEPVSEGRYRCCECGALHRPGPDGLLQPCGQCHGHRHHHLAEV